MLSLFAYPTKYCMALLGKQMERTRAVSDLTGESLVLHQRGEPLAQPTSQTDTRFRPLRESRITGHEEPERRVPGVWSANRNVPQLVQLPGWR